MDTMDNNSKVVTVNGHKFTVQKFPATQALKMKARLIMVAAPILGELGDMVASTNASKQPDVAAIGIKLVGFLPQLDADKVTDLVIELCESAWFANGDMRGERVNFDLAFHDDLTPAYKLAAEVVTFNYAKYLSKLSQGNAPAPTASMQTSKAS